MRTPRLTPLDLSAVAVLLASAAVLVWLRPQPTSPSTRGDELPREPVALTQDDEVLGDRTAGVAVIEYSDFTCPYSARFARETLPILRARYVVPGRVLWVFRHLPLSDLHRFAPIAAEGAVCAGRQRMFWEMHDALFTNVVPLDDTVLSSTAVKVGLDMDSFRKCLNGGTGEVIARHLRSARLLAVRGTPTFLAGTLSTDQRVRVSSRIRGLRPVDAFVAVLDDLVVLER